MACVLVFHIKMTVSAFQGSENLELSLEPNFCWSMFASSNLCEPILVSMTELLCDRIVSLLAWAIHINIGLSFQSNTAKKKLALLSKSWN